MPTHIAVHYHQIVEVVRFQTRFQTHYLQYLMVMNCNMCRHKVPAVFAVKNDFILTSAPYFLPYTWNSLPSYVEEAESLRSFSNLLLSHLEVDTPQESGLNT